MAAAAATLPPPRHVGGTTWWAQGQTRGVRAGLRGATCRTLARPPPREGAGRARRANGASAWVAVVAASSCTPAPAPGLTPTNPSARASTRQCSPQPKARAAWCVARTGVRLGPGHGAEADGSFAPQRQCRRRPYNRPHTAPTATQRRRRAHPCGPTRRRRPCGSRGLSQCMSGQVPRCSRPPGPQHLQEGATLPRCVPLLAAFGRFWPPAAAVQKRGVEHLAAVGHPAVAPSEGSARFIGRTGSTALRPCGSVTVWDMLQV